MANNYWSLPTYQAQHPKCSQQPYSIISPFYRWGNWDTKELIYLPKVTWFLSAEEGFQSWQSPELGLFNLVFPWVKGCAWPPFLKCPWGLIYLRMKSIWVKNHLCEVTNQSWAPENTENRLCWDLGSRQSLGFAVGTVQALAWWRFLLGGSYVRASK